MLWLVGAFVLGCALSAGSSSSTRRQLPAGRSDEPPFLPEELAELQKLGDRLALAKREAKQVESDLVQAKAATDAADRALRLSRPLTLLVLGVLAALTIWGLIACPGDFRPALLIVLSLVWGGLLLAAYHLAGRYEQRLSDASFRQTDCERKLSRAESWSLSGARSLEEARSRFKANAELRRLEELRRRRALEARAVEERAATEIARYVEAQNALAALEKERTRADLASLVKNAFAHYRSAARRPSRFVEAEAQRLVAQEARILAAYSDGTLPGATLDDCMRLAAMALREFPQEVAYWLPKLQDRSVERVAYVLRRYNGDFRERFLPAALELVHMRDPSAQLMPAQKAPADPIRSLPEPLQQLIDCLPRGQAAEVGRKLIDALTLADIGAVKREAIAAMRRELDRQGLKEQAIEEELQTFAINLDTIDRDEAIERGMTCHAATP